LFALMNNGKHRTTIRRETTIAPAMTRGFFTVILRADEIRRSVLQESFGHDTPT
jgi:hypothetical protein